MERPKSLAIADTVNTRTKKSNASMVQPKNPAATALRAFLRGAAEVAVLSIFELPQYHEPARGGAKKIFTDLRRPFPPAPARRRGPEWRGGRTRCAGPDRRSFPRRR